MGYGIAPLPHGYFYTLVTQEGRGSEAGPENAGLGSVTPVGPASLPQGGLFVLHSPMAKPRGDFKAAIPSLELGAAYCRNRQQPQTSLHEQAT